MSIFDKKTKKDESKDEKKKEIKEIKEVNEIRETKNGLKKSRSHLEYLILRPHITEKSSGLSADRKFVFKVEKSANKTEIGKAIEKIYNVKVDVVRIVNMPSKKRRLGRSMGKRSGFKKAIVQLKEGYNIDILPSTAQSDVAKK